MFGADSYSTKPAATASWSDILTSLWKFVSWQGLGLNASIDEKDLAKDPKRLADICRPLCEDMLQYCEYPGSPQIKTETAEALLEYMYKRAVEIGVPLNTNLSSKGFRLGFAMALLAHPRHSVHAQGFIGLFTWLVVQYDDIVGQDNEMVNEAVLFNDRFFRGEPQANNMLQGLAELIIEAREYFDPVIANLMQISALKFITSNTLERHHGFRTMKVHRGEGERFPDFFRDMAGMGWAYSIFMFPKDICPDAGQFMEAIPDMARFIDIANDVISFYKEELGGETKNYIHNRADAQGKSLLTVLDDTNRDTMECVRRINAILKGNGVYERAWREGLQGYLAMHTTNPRYKMKDMGLGETHPLAPFEDRLLEMFARQPELSAAVAQSQPQTQPQPKAQGVAA